MMRQALRGERREVEQREGGTVSAPAKPRTRFDLVSGGFGKIAGGLVNLIIGGIVVFFWRDLGFTLIMLGLRQKG